VDLYVYLIYDRIAEFVILRLRNFVFAIRRCAIIYIWRAVDCYSHEFYMAHNFPAHCPTPKCHSYVASLKGLTI